MATNGKFADASAADSEASAPLLLHDAERQRVAEDAGEESGAAVGDSSPPRARLTINATDLSAPPLSSTPHSAANKPLLYIKTSDSPTSLHSERSRHFHTRKVTRDIAALDFLQNIPMRSEQMSLSHSHGYDGSQPRRHPSPPKWISSRGVFTPTRPDVKKKEAPVKRTEEADEHDADESDGQESDEQGENDDLMSYTYEDEGLAGRRMPGFDSKVVNIPPLFRHRMTTKYPAASAVVRRWESMTAQQGLLESRMYFSRGCGYPLAASTLIKYNGTNEKAQPRKRFMSASNMEPMSYDWRGKSYYRLLHSTWARCDPDRDSQDDHPTATPYLPNYLDDPEFRQGRHRHVVRGDKNIGPVVSSILLFVKPNELKEELNQKFREKHTWLHDNELSLSKIRNLKRETLTTSQRVGMEMATVALACVYFEKLVLNHYVTKANRKLYMSVCLLLATKFNEPMASDAMKTMIKQILADIDQIHSIPSREVLTTEFKVYAQLSFSLHVPLAEIQPHFTRLLKLVESNPRKYLDDDVFNEYSRLVLEEVAQTSHNSNTDNEGLMSVDGETQDEGTDAEALMSDEETEEETDSKAATSGGGGGGGDTGRRRTLPPWHNMPSFAQWWRERRWDTKSTNDDSDSQR